MVALSTEMGLGEAGTYKIGKDFGYFRSNASRIAKIGGSNHYYWTRSPNASYSYGVRYVNSDGSGIDYSSAYMTYPGVRPALHLKSGTKIEHISGVK